MRRTHHVAASFCTLALLWTACAAEVRETGKQEIKAGAEKAAGAATAVDPAELLPNGKIPVEGVLAGGQPTEAQLAHARDLGYRTVVNLRTPGEEGATTPGEVESLGMKYVAFPIAGPADLDEAHARQFAEILAKAERPVIIHCASGNRVGALFAMKAWLVDGKPPAEALELGKAAGLTHLEPAVREKMGLH
ncbi:MAG TPA: sulfur transferase domain-containing protein [Candidatus Saccharimonadales bacterium]|nr:sulfur transferase domain-containing protein [Candidatus Saccharimonadales bacterium]